MPAQRRGRSADPWPAVERGDVRDRLDQYLTDYARANQFAGVALIAQHGQVIASGVYGSKDIERNTPHELNESFPVASVSKTFTGAALVVLAVQGRLALSDTLAKWIPEYPQAASVTLEQLLTHTSGVPTVDDPDVYLSGVSYAELVRRMQRRPLAFEPGSKSAYQSQGYMLLALVIERASGASIDRFLSEKFFEPLGMRRSSAMHGSLELPAGHHAGTAGRALRRVERNEVPDIGGGSVVCSGPDLLAWLEAIRKDRFFERGKLAHPYGWGCRTYAGRGLIEQTGQLEGFNAYVALYPAEGASVVVLSNVQSGMFSRIGADMAAILFGGAPSQPPRIEAAMVEVDRLAEFAGTYRAAQVELPMHLRVEGQSLSLRWGEYPFARPLVALSSDRFFLPAEYSEVRFDRDASGTVSSSVWTWPSANPVRFRRQNATP